MRRRLSLFISAVAVMTLALIGPLAAAQPADAIGEPALTNPLVGEADPTVEWFQGNYYYAATTWTGMVTMRKSPTLAGLKTAAASTVWSDTAPDRSATMWAPELRRLNGPNGWRWYLMYTMGPSSGPGTQRLHVLESAGDDPMGPYAYKGRPVPTDEWHIDGSYMELGGELFLLWSQFAPDGLQSNYIARMADPWTATSTGSILSQPTESWETIGGAVNEGPIAVQHAGSTFIAFSASGCWTPDYQLGLLTYNGGDATLAGSWTKTPAPVFSKANGVFGPGHNDFFTSPDGTETWNVYHGNASATDGCGTTRTSRAQPVSWDSAGNPQFGSPVATTAEIPVPAGERGPRDVPVPAATFELVNRNSGLCAAITEGSADGAPLVQSACTGSSASSTAWKLDSTADGFYRLINAASAKVLDAANCGTSAGTALRQWAWLANRCQQWSAGVAADGYLTWTNRNSGLTLDVANCAVADGAAVRLWSPLGNACQQWSLRPIGSVAVLSAASGKSLDIPSCSTAPGALLQQWQWMGSPCQRWSFTPATAGFVEIRPGSAPGSCLSVSAGGMADGAAVVQGACGGAHSGWRLEPLPAGGFRIVAAHSAKVLDLANCALADGAAIVQWSNLMNECQRFRIVS